MSPEFKTFLATEVISEGKIVSYRNVSRALKVHVNAAKCMLYEFHERENMKKHGSIHATYLISGRKKAQDLSGLNDDAPHQNGDADEPMPSSPPGYPSSLPGPSQATEVLEERHQVPVTTVTLCREEDLEAVKEEYEQISSVHVYSVSAVRIQDLVTLTESSRRVFVDFHVKLDPLVHNKDYGIIQNPNVWRRKGKRPENIAAPEPKLEPKKEKLKPFAKADSNPAPTKEEQAASRPPSRDSTTTQDSSRSKPNLKRDGSSLFKAFAKQTAKPKLERKDTDTSVASDAKMSGMDDEDEGESEDEAMFLDTGTSKGKPSSKKRASDIQREKEERQAKLRKMMDDDEEEAGPAVPKLEDAAGMDGDPPAAKNTEDPDAPNGDGDKVDWSDSDTEKKVKQNVVDEGPTRRRGKRKVMKKKTTQDEDGFLVTKEEEVWESFSEDEPEATQAQVKKPAFPPKSSAPAKGGLSKGPAAKGSGAAAGGKKKDIMSFFGKK